jgi:hypothetical protein
MKLKIRNILAAAAAIVILQPLSGCATAPVEKINAIPSVYTVEVSTSAYGLNCPAILGTNTFAGERAVVFPFIDKRFIDDSDVTTSIPLAEVFSGCLVSNARGCGGMFKDIRAALPATYENKPVEFNPAVLEALKKQNNCSVIVWGEINYLDVSIEDRRWSGECVLVISFGGVIKTSLADKSIRGHGFSVKKSYPASLRFQNIIKTSEFFNSNSAAFMDVINNAALNALSQAAAESGISAPAASLGDVLFYPDPSARVYSKLKVYTNNTIENSLNGGLAMLLGFGGGMWLHIASNEGNGWGPPPMFSLGMLGGMLAGYVAGLVINSALDLDAPEKNLLYVSAAHSGIDMVASMNLLKNRF